MDNLYALLTIIFLAIILSSLLAVPLINILYKFKIIRHADVDFSTLIENRKEKTGTPIMGGLIFVITIIVLNVIFNLYLLTLVILIIFACAALLGAIDDSMNIFGKPRKIRSLSRVIKLIKVHKDFFVRIRFIILFPWFVFERFMHVFESNPGNGLRAHEKVLIQAIIGAILGVLIYKEIGGFLWLPFVHGIDLGYFIIPFAVFVLLAMTNAVNIADGLDGLSAGMAIFAYIGFLIIAVIEGKWEIALLIGTVVGSLVSYLYFNISPARVQMGDTGSLALGALLAAVAFVLNKPMLLPVIGLPFTIEILSTLVQSFFRRVLGRRLFKMAPLHHHFELLGWSEEKVVMRFWLFSAFCVVLGLWFYFQ